nr:hypothetical protein DM860_016163 [Ipomoea trifida]
MKPCVFIMKAREAASFGGTLQARLVNKTVKYFDRKLNAMVTQMTAANSRSNSITRSTFKPQTKKVMKMTKDTSTGLPSGVILITLAESGRTTIKVTATKAVVKTKECSDSIGIDVMLAILMIEKIVDTPLLTKSPTKAVANARRPSSELMIFRSTSRAAVTGNELKNYASSSSSAHTCGKNSHACLLVLYFTYYGSGVTRPPASDSEDETGHRFPAPIREATLPDGSAGDRSNGGSGGVAEARDGEVRVEVLAHLSNYPIRDGPGVNPRDVARRIAAFDEHDGGADGVDRLVLELERIGGGGGIGSAGEDAHQKLVRRRAMEPPLEIGGQKLLDFLDVA